MEGDVMPTIPPKASSNDFPGRFREIISDPLNLMITRVPMAGHCRGDNVCLHNGNWVPLSGEGSYYGAFSQILIFNRGVHEPLEEYVFQEVLKVLPEQPSMIELGAYWGHYAMWLQRAHPRSGVTLVEPDPVGLEAGRENFRRNGYTGDFIQAAVGRGKFSIDAFFADRRTTHLSILHADIQGFEIEMLAGAASALSAATIDYLFLSTHSQVLHETALGEIEKHGYRVEVSSDFDHETTAHDGFVFASSPRARRVFPAFRPLSRHRIAVAEPDEIAAYLETLRASAR